MLHEANTIFVIWGYVFKLPGAVIDLLFESLGAAMDIFLVIKNI